MNNVFEILCLANGNFHTEKHESLAEALASICTALEYSGDDDLPVIDKAELLINGSVVLQQGQLNDIMWKHLDTENARNYERTQSYCSMIVF